jgi:hypothetical protein
MGKAILSHTSGNGFQGQGNISTSSNFLTAVRSLRITAYGNPSLRVSRTLVGDEVDGRSPGSRFVVGILPSRFPSGFLSDANQPITVAGTAAE